MKTRMDLHTHTQTHIFREITTTTLIRTRIFVKRKQKKNIKSGQTSGKILRFSHRFSFFTDCHKKKVCLQCMLEHNKALSCLIFGTNTIRALIIFIDPHSCTCF